MNLKFIKISKYSDGFTLAEVLITLVIIGIIAAMTIPTLIQSYEERQTVSALKKAYSTLDNAIRLSATKNGALIDFIDGSQNSSAETCNKLAEILLPVLSVSKNCGLSTDGDCWPPESYRLNGALYTNNTSNPNTNANLYKLVLSDGMSIYWDLFTDCAHSRGNNEYLQNLCGVIHVDINGHKNPNTAGRDQFEFWLTPYGIYPRGTQYEADSSNSKLENSGGCNNKEKLGFGCSAWVLTKGNLDYLHKTVSWTE